MRFRQDLTLRDYLAAADETTRELIDQPTEMVEGIEEAYRFFAEGLWIGDVEVTPVVAFLSMNAFMILLSGVRTALGGHASAIFPPLRTAVESACYAYQIVKNPDLEQVWIDRHRDADALKASRRAFGSAVADTAKSLGEVRSDYGDLVSECYDAAIDFGGHPNPRAILGHLSFEDVEDDQYQHVGFGALYGGESWHTQRSLIACLDYAVVLGIILIHTLPDIPPDTARALDMLNTTKERLAASLAS